MAGKKGCSGRPRIKYNADTAKQVLAMSQYGLPQDKIAVVIGMAPMTLCKLYATELERGHALASLTVSKTLYEKCMNGDTTSLIFWCKTQLGWREKDKQVADQQAKTDSKRELVAAIQEAFRSVGR